MNIYDRKSMSGVLLSERLTAELRNVQSEVKLLEKLVTSEIQHLKDVIRKQNSNALNYENLRNTIGNSRSAVITFTKPGDKLQSTQPALFVKNNTYSGEKLKRCCSFTKNKSYTISATNVHSLGSDKKVKFETKTSKLQRTNSDRRSVTFDYVKRENTEVLRTSMLAYRLENVFISEVQKISSVLEQLRIEVDKCFNKKKITEHYMGNKYRNAQVREDFPCALDEQIREQRLAEQAAALYHQMITEQEEQDAEVAKQLADKIEREELAKKRALEEEDEEIAKQILEREHLKQLDKQQRLLTQQSLQTQPATSSLQRQQHMEQHSPLTQSPRKPEHHDSPRKGESHDMSRRPEYHESPKRQGYLMPLPTQSPNIHTVQQLQQPVAHASTATAHYRSSSDDLLDPFQQCSIADALELGLPVDEVDEKRMQEERDAELARKLQEQESCSAEELQLNRDRMLAIEAQDKELAKLLQERERAKVRRAKERAKQKALAKKQQELNPDQILPDDSYSNPIDLLQHPECSHSSNSMSSTVHTQSYRIPPQDCHAHDDDVNYSLPVDMVSGKAAYDHNLKQNYSPQKNYESRLNGYNHKSEIRAMNGGYLPGGSSHLGASGLTQERETLVPAVRPTQLDLKSPITKSMKPRPDPDSIEVCESLQPDNNYPLHNIAMAIDPTYTRRTLSSHTPSSQDTSTISTSTTSSTTSPAISLPPPDLSEDEMSPVPPYMPIQGQRRTASLEKKKKRAKDGCKQQ